MCFGAQPVQHQGLLDRVQGPGPECRQDLSAQEQYQDHSCTSLLLAETAPVAAVAPQAKEDRVSYLEPCFSAQPLSLVPILVKSLKEDQETKAQMLRQVPQATQV